MTLRRVLLDANMLIAALDLEGSTDAEVKKRAKNRLAELVGDDTVALVITPLIRYEVLRGVAWSNEARFEQLRTQLNGYVELETVRAVSERAADLFRLDREEHRKDQAYNVDKRRFDTFHVACARFFDLDLVSNDPHIEKLLELHDRLPLALRERPPN